MEMANRKWDQLKIKSALVSGLLVLSLSSCASPIEVPSVWGEDIVTARSELAKLGLVAEVNSVKALEPEGTVLSVSPEIGTQIENDGVVTLEVSSGPDAYLPDLIGQNSGFYKGKLAKLKLEYTVTREFSDEVEKGLVITTDPAAGDPVLFSTPITVVVSKGRKPTLIENAYSACGYPDVDVADKGMTILIDTPSDLFMSLGMRPNYDDVVCLLNQINTPSYIISAIEEVRAIDGRQTQEFDTFEISYSYHPDHGISMTIHDKGN